MVFFFINSFFLVLFAIPIREVSEWLKELAWKASMWATASRVRIPSSLQILKLLFYLKKNSSFLFSEYLTLEF